MSSTDYIANVFAHYIFQKRIKMRKWLLKKVSKAILLLNDVFIIAVEKNEATNEQWFLDFEDSLNYLSTIDHNHD